MKIHINYLETALIKYQRLAEGRNNDAFNASKKREAINALNRILLTDGYTYFGDTEDGKTDYITDPWSPRVVKVAEDEMAFLNRTSETDSQAFRARAIYLHATLDGLTQGEFSKPKINYAAGYFTNPLKR